VVIGIGLVIRNVINNSKNSDNWQKDSKDKAYYQVTISLLDKDDNSFIEGAVLIVRTEAGQVLEKWTTSDEEYIITMVPKGDYTLEQVSAADGYIINEENIEFTVTDKDIELVMYNEIDNYNIDISNNSEDIPVVNTLSIRNPLTSILGISIIGFGVMLIVFYKKKIKDNG
jgi:uncharacterized surface anchored protein